MDRTLPAVSSARVVMTHTWWIMLLYNPEWLRLPEFRGGVAWALMQCCSLLIGVVVQSAAC
jgi:hypothetical protein